MVEGDEQMHVYVFHGSGWWGFTQDPSARNLPADKGPWTPDTTVLFVLKDYPLDRPLVNEAEILSAIESQGYYLTNDAEVARKLEKLKGE
jgi:hypothetical protein